MTTLTHTLSPTNFVILPIHLFDIDTLTSHLKKNTLPDLRQINFYLIEEPIYFGYRTLENKLPTKSNKPLNFNKLKLIFHRATMKYYQDYLKKHIPNISLTYIDFKELNVSSKYKFLKRADTYMFSPIDSLVEEKYAKVSKTIKYLDTPLFLCSEKDLADYDKTKKTKNSYYHSSFYNWQRERLNILPNSKTYDTQNRNPLPLTVPIPPLPSNDSTSKANKHFLTEAISYIQHHFPNNLEPLDNPIIEASIHFPISHTTSQKWLQHFCVNRLSQFGKYEDSIDSRPYNFLFHSAISPMLNTGLITPSQVIDTVTNYYNKHKSAIGIANYEGFIRQVIGWREYQRYIYRYAGEKMRMSNHFRNGEKLSRSWYEGTLGVKPVDDAIKMAVNDGYIHHILRLMVMGNFMNLVGLHPHQVYKWFMEFSLDSYDWVMVGNVYSMALWADAGLSMRKPYISGSGYILSMGNFKDSDEWAPIWNALLHHFINRNSDQLSKTYYNGLVKAWHRKSENERQTELKIASDFISKIGKISKN